MQRTINLNSSYKQHTSWGFIDEHNITTLVFHLPPELADCNHCRVAINYGGVSISSDSIVPTDNTVIFKLSDTFTNRPIAVSAQLICYGTDDDGDIIGKTNPFYGKIEQGVEDGNTPPGKSPGFLDRIWTKVYALLEKMHSHTNADTLDKFSENESGGLLYNGKDIGGIKSVTALPETAVEGDVVLLHRCNKITVDDSNSGILLDIPAIVALGVPEGYEQRVWEIKATDPKGEGFSVTLEIKRIDDYILTGLMIAAETVGGRWYWKNGELTTDITGASTDPVPVHIPLGYVDGFTFTKTLYDLDYWETADTDETVIFRTLPLQYAFVGGEWQLAKNDDVADGAIIGSVAPREKDGRNFLRLTLLDSRNLKLDNDTPKWIDIPVSGINSVTEQVGGIKLNGSELDFGIKYTNDELAKLKIILGVVQNNIKELYNDTVPLVTELPTDANFGDICRYARSNELSTDDAGKKIYFNPNWTEGVKTISDNQTWDWILGAVYGQKTFISCRVSISNKNKRVALEIHADEGAWAVYHRIDEAGDLVLLTNESYFIDRVTNDIRLIDSMPKVCTIPVDEDEYISADNADIPFTLFYHEPKLMIYLGEWVEFPSKAELESLKDTALSNYKALSGRVKSLEEVSHEHENKAILENFTEDENGELLYKGEAVGSSIESTYITPQMFGAVADGKTDDTVAVQAALNHGGVVYFPAGVYKVTKQLTTTKPCVIKMFKQYPSRFWRSGKSAGRYDYPLQIFEGESDYESEKGWDFGARLECYPSEGEQYGLLIGDGCEVDGLFMRAMNGFSGVLLAYDNSHEYGTDNLGDPITYTSYPSAARFKHIRLDCDRHHTETTIPESMFDFYPHGKYFYIFDDIVIGQQNEFATYGFRSVVDEEATWANSVRLTNLCLNGLFDYPLYIVEENTKHSLTNWIFEGLSIQTYGYTYNEFEQAREGHKAVMTLKRMNYCMFSGCYIWDLYAAKYVKLFDCENLNNISCVGCSEEFYYGTKKLVGDDGEEGIETVLKGRLQEVADDANVKTLAMSANTLEDGSTRISISDNHGNTVGTDIPAVSLSDEQISTGVGNWMTENANPVEQVGRNKLNIYSNNMLYGYGLGKTGKPGNSADAHRYYVISHYIPAKYGDVFRMGLSGTAANWSDIVEFDKDYNFLKYHSYNDEDVIVPGWFVTLTDENTAYIRVSLNLRSNLCTEEEVNDTDFVVNLETVERGNFCVTLNDADISYEPYGIELVGGLASYFKLQSPNGTRYSVAVTDDGVVVGKDENGNIVDLKTSQLVNDSNYVTSAVTDELRNSINALRAELTGATTTVTE